MNGTNEATEALPALEAVAVVGMSCKFGGAASSPTKLWEMMAAGKDSWSTIPESRFDVKSLYHPDPNRMGRHNVEGGYFIDEDIHLYDAAFFKDPAESASAMDPQLRLLMEGVYEAIENGKHFPISGMPLEKIAGTNTSVYTGVFGRDNADMLMKDPETLPTLFVTGNGLAMFSNRISHFYNLQGPSLTIDVGCSGSMVALHLAVQSIRSGESSMSIVGGSSVLQNPDLYIALSQGGILNPEGRCFAWDHRWGGYGRGEGTACLVLKSLETAMTDGDHIHAVIRETGLNQDGKTGTITSPSMEAQKLLMEQCYRRAGLDMSTVGYLEAHMTGTSGDPIEAESIARTFGKTRTSDDPLYVGSVKTQIGHTEAVSGIAAVVKTALVLQHQMIPPNLNYEKSNPNIPLEEWNLRVPTELTAWPQDRPLRASINNFGYGGTNGHLILDAPPHLMAARRKDSALTNGTNGVEDHLGPLTSREEPSSYVCVLSSRGANSTKVMQRDLVAHLRNANEQGYAPHLSDLAYTLAERRSQHSWTTAVRARSLSDLIDRLEEPHRKAKRAMPKQPRIGFVFSGQGAQWYGMGRELLSAYPVFKTGIVHASEILQKDYGASWSLYEELTRDEEASRVHEVHLSQPLTVALQLCLVDLLRSWNITPSAVGSHSSGEIAAAYAAELLSFKEALGVVYYRGEVALKHQKLNPMSGGMLAAGLGAEDARKYLSGQSGGTIVVACVNSPQSVTLSGDLAALDDVAERLEDDGIFTRKLKVPLAYHSHHMKQMAPDYERQLQTILPRRERTATVPFVSPVTGDLMTSPESFGAAHWVANLVSPVLFSQVVERMVLAEPATDQATAKFQSATNVDILLEIGAHDSLSGPVRQTLGDKSLPYFPCLKRPANAVDTMQDVACELLSRGYPVSLTAVNPYEKSTTHSKYITGLPSYPWNHTISYHAEPRASREHRVKRFPPHELLGSPVAGVNKHTPTWRSFLRVQDIPWLSDHKLEGQVVLPGAGFIAMAIEAVRLLKAPSRGSNTDNSISGYRLRDVEFMNALIIPPSPTGVETIVSLRSCSERELDHRNWYEFEVWSVAGSPAAPSWVQHCTACVSAEPGSKAASEGVQRTLRMLSNDKEQHQGLAWSLWPPTRKVFLTSAPVQHLEPEEIFSNMDKMEFSYGPSFQNLIGSDVVGERSVTDFHLAPTALEETYGDNYVLHPTTLDSIFQSCYGCLAGGTQETAVFLPRRIGSIFVPSSLGSHEGHKLEAFMELSRLSKRDAAFNGLVAPLRRALTDAALSEEVQSIDSTCLRLDNLQLSRIQQDSEDSAAKRLYSKSRWEPDVLHDVPSSIKQSMRIWLSESELDFHRRLREVSYHFVRDAVSRLNPQQSDKWQWHHRKFYDWMKTLLESADNGHLEKGSGEWWQRSTEDKEKLFASIRSENVAGEMVCKMGPQLVSIIEGGVTPLELMMEDGLLHRLYEEGPEKGRLRCLRHQSRQLLELFIAKQPGAEVLEIGAGTGSATAYALDTLTRGGRDTGGQGSLLGRYHFTDISAGFFEPAKAKFGAYANVMTYNKLDIEVDPEQQGFVAGRYDLILAAEVLHATKNLKRTLTNVRKLLKPGGKFLLCESTRASPDSQLTFGTLPGWWLSEEPERAGGPLIDVKTWDHFMRSCGFTGVEFEIGDCEDGEVMFSTLMLTTADSPSTSLPTEVSVVYDANAPESWLTELATTLKRQTGCTAVLEPFASIKPDADRTYLVALDMAGSILDDITADVFERLRSLLVDSRGLLWLSCGGCLDTQEPRVGQTWGLLRALRREDAVKRCVQLDFDSAPGNAWTAESIQHIVHVFRQGFDYGSQEPNDWEYAVKDSSLHVPRLYPDLHQDRSCSASTKPAPEIQPFQTPDRQLIWDISDDGLLEKLQWAEQPHVDVLPDGMIEIEPKVFGLNFRDVLIAMGMLTPDRNGQVHEAAGTVTRLGPGTEMSGLRVGDRVCGVFDGFFASRSRASWMGAAKIPDNMSWAEGVSIPYAFVTAYHGLITVAELKKGERILIHAAAGGVGQAAVMIAQDIGAEVFVTCGTEEKRALLQERYSIPADHVFTSRDTSFARKLMAVTRGEGVEVVLNSLAGPLLKATWECLARFGRFVEIGKMDIETGKQLDMTPFGRGVMFAAIDLSLQRLYTPRVVHDELLACVDLCRRGRVRPVHPITAWSVAEMNMAMKHMQAGKHIGKIVVEASPEAEVSVLRNLPPLDLTDANSTYMIVGGMTGLGHAIACYMIDKGASHLLIVSRNAVTHEKAVSLRQKAREHGCNLQVRDCDISDEKDLLHLLDSLQTGMPAIRGVIQGGMVLDDTVLERMKFEQWQTAIRPRVAGTLNIHNHLPNLRFFVMLSSTAGVTGIVSQSNYCAGNTFMDALARHRTSRGLPAVTIDLGRVADAGYVHEASAEVKKRLETTYGSLNIPLAHLMRLIEQAIREPLRPHPDDSQIITSLSSYEVLPNDPTTKGDKRFGTLRLGNTAKSSLAANAAGSSRVDELVQELMAVGAAATDDQPPDVGKAAEIVRALLAAKIGDIFHIEASEVELSLPLTHFGVDSLVAVQMRNWMTSVVKARVTIFEILQTGSLHDFATLIASRSTLVVKKPSLPLDVNGKVEEDGHTDVNGKVDEDGHTAEEDEKALVNGKEGALGRE